MALMLLLLLVRLLLLLVPPLLRVRAVWQQLPMLAPPPHLRARPSHRLVLLRVKPLRVLPRTPADV
jgi:hypothetical protein